LGGRRLYYSRKKKINEGKKAFDALAAFFAERAKIEEAYANSLEKLLKKTEDVVEIGSVKVSWDVVCAELDKRSKLHHSLSAQFKNSVVGPIDNFIKEQQKKRKETLTDASKLIKDYRKMVSSIEKSQEKYNKTSQQKTALEAKIEQAKTGGKADKQMSKLNKTQQKTSKEITLSEAEYQDQINKLTSYQPEWESKVGTLYDALQDLEETRLEMVQHSLEKYVLGEKLGEDFVKESCAKMNEALGKINVTQDVLDWISENKTGTVPPSCPTFVSFGGEVLQLFLDSYVHTLDSSLKYCIFNSEFFG